MAYRDPPRYGLRVITPPEEEPIELEEAMVHLNIDLEDRHADAWLNSNIRAARRFCEGYTARALAPQTLEVVYGAQSSGAVPTYWQPTMMSPLVDADGVIVLPMGPVTSVESFKYLDSAGDLQTLATDQYVLDEWSRHACVYLASGGAWPTALAARNSIRIRYMAGYTFPDDSPSAYPLPDDLRTAMLLVLGHFFENRGNSAPVKIEEIPLGAKILMEPYSLRLGMA